MNALTVYETRIPQAARQLLDTAADLDRDAIPAPLRESLLVLENTILRETAQTAQAEAATWKRELIAADEKIRALELESLNWGAGVDNLRDKIAELEAQAARREGYIVEVEGRFEDAAGEKGALLLRIEELEKALLEEVKRSQWRGARIAELEARPAETPKQNQERVFASDQAAARLASLDQLATEQERTIRELRASLETSIAAEQELRAQVKTLTGERDRRAAEAATAETPRVIEGWYPPPCEHCGKKFSSLRERNPHVLRCPQNPARITPPGRPRRRDATEAAELPQGAYICPECNGTAFGKSPKLDMCMKCAADLSKAA